MPSGSAVDRRDALKRLVLYGLGAAAVPSWVERLSALAVDHAGHARAAGGRSSTAWTPAALDSHQNETVVLLSESIIPETDTPGAKAAKVNEFIDAVVADAAPSERETFLSGLIWLDTRSRDLFGAEFIGCQPEQQGALLTILASPVNTSAADQPGVEFFQAIKAMTITGYYTSEVGMKTELGEDGSLFFTEYAGCTHSEHK